jgi:prepilin-type N-terminal cleavage/methylation domain-containing protein
MKTSLPKNKDQHGFTIIELMIATSVLSVILLLVTVMMISIGSLFYKEINQSRVQDSVRSITDEVSHHLQLSGTTPLSGSYSGFGTPIGIYCIGDTRYSFIKNVQINSMVGGVFIYHVLWRDVPSGGCDPTQPSANLTIQDPSSGHESATDTNAELIPPNSRLTEFSITKPSPYNISVGIAYGANSLLNLAGINTTCKSTTGDQFCATASLTTTVANRL